MTQPRVIPPNDPRHRKVAWSIAGVSALMLGLSFAAVPLYREFCRETGFGGTTQVSQQAPTERGARTFTVRFDTNTEPGLPLAFEPEVPSIRLRTGETATVFFKVHNRSDRPVATIAGYNVAPDQSGAYFDKISCFCFDEQHMGPGESAEWPVVFYLDPALEKDKTMAEVDAVTLSYVLYASKRPPVAAAAATTPGG